MSVSNLLSITCRKNADIEPELKALTQTRVEAFVANNISAGSNIFVGDTATLNGRVLDIMGNLTDSQIESVMKTGFDKTVDKMLEVITTCEDITDSELLNICAVNPSGAPARLRIIRKSSTSSQNTPTVAPTEAPTEAPTTAPTEAPTEVPTEAPTEIPTEAPTEIPTEAPTEVPTEAPTEIPTEVPTEVPTEAPTDPPTEAPIENYTLVRKGANSKSMTLTGTEIVVKLTNCVDGKDYFYKLCTTDGSSQDIDLELMANDRFLIRGNNIKVTAYEGQNDSLIILGGNNIIDTNSGDDIIRVNYVTDSDPHLMFNPNDYLNNKVNAGAGNDYIFMNSYLSTTDGGGGTDVLKYAVGVSLSESAGYCSSSNIEYKLSSSEITTNYFDNKLEGGGQGHYGDCKFLSFINSLNVQGVLGNYVQITGSGSTYYVKFLQGADKNPVTVTLSELQSDSNASKGDIEFSLIEAAFRKLIASEGAGYTLENTNGDETHDAQCLAPVSNNWLISKYIYGNTAASSRGDIAGYIYTEAMPTGVTLAENKIRYENDFKILLQAYKNKEISNLTVCTTSTQNRAIGVMKDHAYTVKDGVIGQYVIVVNPWDGNDEIKLDWNDFFENFVCILLYGDSYKYAYDHRGSGGIKSLVGNNGSGGSFIYTGSYDDEIVNDTYEEKSSSIYSDLISEENGVDEEIDEISCHINTIKEMLYEEQKLNLCW